MNDVALEITVKADGSIIATTHNVTGSACLDYIAVLEDMLEAETVQSSYTADFSRGTVIDSTPEAVQQQVQRDVLGDV